MPTPNYPASARSSGWRAARCTTCIAKGWTSAIRGSLVYDSRNDRMFPTYGQFHLLSAEIADKYLGSGSTTFA